LDGAKGSERVRACADELELVNEVQYLLQVQGVEFLS